MGLASWRERISWRVRKSIVRLLPQPVVPKYVPPTTITTSDEARMLEDMSVELVRSEELRVTANDLGLPLSAVGEEDEISHHREQTFLA